MALDVHQNLKRPARCHGELVQDDKATEALTRYTTIKGGKSAGCTYSKID